MTIEEAMFEFYEGVTVLGPGSEVTTNKLLKLVPNHNNIKQALDIGCGTGRSTFALANTGIHTTAIDVYQPFLDYINKTARQKGLQDNIKTMQSSMDSLDLPEKSFDLVWSEASAYSMGFHNALRYWKEFLKPDGYVVVTELCWTSDKPSKEIAKFWSEEYTGMKNISELKSTIKACGYKIVSYFTLPESDWQNYYIPLKLRVNEYQNDNRPAMQYVIKQTLKEISMREKYASDYEYFAFVIKPSLNI